MASRYITLIPFISFLLAIAVLIYEQYQNLTSNALACSLLLLFSASYTREDEKVPGLERLGLMLAIGLMALVLTIDQLIPATLSLYLIMGSIGLKKKTFANFFGPITVFVAALLTVTIGMRSEVLSTFVITWSVLLLGLFASGRSSNASLITLAPFLIQSVTKIELPQIHFEVTLALIAWCFIEVSQKSFYRLAIALTTLALWMSPQHPWVAVATALIFIPSFRFINIRHVRIIATVLSLMVALSATLSLWLGLAITVLALVSFRMIYQNNFERTEATV